MKKLMLYFGLLLLPLLVVCQMPSTSAAQDYYDGHTLFAPLRSTDTYLIDMNGDTVYTWSSDYTPGQSVYLLENGTLAHTAALGNNATFSSGGGAGGRIEYLDSDSNVIWFYEYSQDQGHLQHHDIEVLPSGNILLIAWEYKTAAEAIAAGRNPALLRNDELWPDTIIEIEPDDSSGGTVVWEWHVWDHLIQDFDAGQANFGVVGDHPELIDVNYVSDGGSADWTHVNSVAYLEELDQIMISIHNFCEIWIIDHSTTTAQAASHTGGQYGMGGDLLYRWGNPQAYNQGTANDQMLYGQHDATWIPDGYPGEGDILIFNNGLGRPAGNYSTVDQITPPLAADGTYTMTGNTYGPDALSWQYIAPTPTDFYSSSISGAQRLPNGNTLICEGETGYFFEVTDGGTKAWDYTHTNGNNNAVFRTTRYATDYPGLPEFGGGGGGGGGSGGCFIRSTDRTTK